jgi:hypothetical protein
MSRPVQNPIVQTSTGAALAPFFVETSRCSSSSYGVDMPRPAHSPVVHRCPVGVFMFLIPFRWYENAPAVSGARGGKDWDFSLAGLTTCPQSQSYQDPNITAFKLMCT